MNEKIITISSGTIFKAILIIGLFWLLYFFRDLIIVLLMAIVIASAIEPLTKWFIRYKIPRVLAVIFIYLSFAVGLTGVFYFFLPPLIEDMVGIVTAVPQYLETLELDGSLGSGLLGSKTIVGGLSDTLSIKDTVIGIRDALSSASGGLVQSVSTVFGGLLSLVLIVVISFYLAVQEKGIEKFLRLITPVKHEKYIVSLWGRSQRKIGLWMQGQLLLGLIVGVLVFLGP